MCARGQRQGLHQREQDEDVDEPDDRPVDERIGVLGRRARGENRHDCRDKEDQQQGADELCDIGGGASILQRASSFWGSTTGGNITARAVAPRLPAVRAPIATTAALLAVLFGG